jgi:hypothetical protein
MVQLFPLMRVVALANRLRVALAGDDQRTARRAALRLDKSDTQLGHAWAAIARAAATTEPRARCDQLSRAEVLFESRSIQLHVAAARWRRGHSLLATADDGRGPALIAAAQEILETEGIAEPERVVAMLLPGAW